MYTKAAKILDNFETGATIAGKNGLWLAIPTPDAPRSGKRVLRPAEAERRLQTRLHFVYRPNGVSLLVADNRRASFSKKSGQLRGFNKASQSALKTGRSLASVVLFWLVPQVKMPKRLDFKGAGSHWQKQLPKLILNNWKTSKP